MGRFKELLKASMKSKDTEEWLDVHFTRPIGLVFALLWKRLGVHPNAVTILSIFLGIGAAYCFYFVDVWHNVCGVLLLMFANFCDSTDGQLARLTGKHTFIGRMLDGFASGLWFVGIYVALALRMQHQLMPGTTVPWGAGIWTLALVAGVLCHTTQSSLGDYYRQIHLYFLKGEGGSELGHSRQQYLIYKHLDKGDWLKRLFYLNYTSYCRSQERRTPAFQKFFQRFKSHPDNTVRQQFLEGSRPLMPYTNILTFNTRAICLYVTCLLNCPWLYFIFEITVLQLIYIYMHQRHEKLCREMISLLSKTATTQQTNQS